MYFTLENNPGFQFLNMRGGEGKVFHISCKIYFLKVLQLIYLFICTQRGGLVKFLA